MHYTIIAFFVKLRWDGTTNCQRTTTIQTHPVLEPLNAWLQLRHNFTVFLIASATGFSPLLASCYYALPVA